MARGRPLQPLNISDEVHDQLESLSRSRSMSHALVRRAKIVLMSDCGLTNQEIAERVGLSGASVGKWRRRFCEQGLMGLYDELRPGGPRSVSDEEISSLIYKTLKKQPKGATHWDLSFDGRRDGALQVLGSTCMESFWTATASTEALQTVERSLLRRESQGYRRSIPEPTGQRDGALCRREEPDSSTRTDTTDSSFGSRIRRGRHSQLYPERHDHPLCSAQHRIRQSSDSVQAQTPQQRVPSVPQAHRQERPSYNQKVWKKRKGDPTLPVR